VGDQQITRIDPEPSFFSGRSHYFWTVIPQLSSCIKLCQCYKGEGMRAKQTDFHSISGIFLGGRVAGGCGMVGECFCGWSMGKKLQCFLLNQPKIHKKNCQVKS
jgi:hypothetical protein